MASGAEWKICILTLAIRLYRTRMTNVDRHPIPCLCGLDRYDVVWFFEVVVAFG